jgi:hypothetical protein
MADFARRSLTKFTYSPIKPDESDQRSGLMERRQRGLEKAAFGAALQVGSREVDAAARLAGPQQPSARTVLGLLADLADPDRAIDARRKIVKLPSSDLVAAGQALARLRRDRRTEFRRAARSLVEAHANALRRHMETAAAPAVAPPADNETARRRGLASTPSARPAVSGRSAADLRTSFASALTWARVHQPGLADRLGEMARGLPGLAVDFDDLEVATADDLAVDEAANNGPPDPTGDLTAAFEERMKIEPIGRLHLERIDMVPVGVVRGELIHAVGLAPKETITLIHREWSSRSTTFDKVVAEEFEQSSEDSVTENTELASATETQSRHASSLSMEASASGSYGFASASLTFGYNTSSEDEEAKRTSRNHSVEVTSKAASRTRKEHKVTFTVKEEAGVEDQSTRVLSNPSATDPMRIDFHQLVRKWQVDLYRYGLRLTYDIVVPAPGTDLLAKVDLLRRIDNLLAEPFSFALTAAAITRENWTELAAQYNGEVEPPPPKTLALQQSFDYPLQTPEESESGRLDAIAFDVPDEYTVTSGEFAGRILFHPNGVFDVMNDWAPGIVPTINDVHWYDSGLELLYGRTGRQDVVMYAKWVKTAHCQATLTCTLNETAYMAWQARAWAQLRRGAEETQRAVQAELRERRNQLAAELEQWDPLTLRRMEREEIMKAVLKWIFGPEFALMPADIASLYSGGGMQSVEPAHLTRAEWARVMRFGEMMKFLHQAIEWENVLFHVYPYFWDAPHNHALKLFLQYPDSIHRAFLRGGAARVVLTVRPGFEESFTELFETSFLGEVIPAGDHPYLTIAQEIQNYARTNYPGIPGASEGEVPSEEEVGELERGKHIARWYEYTPVSALDITVNTPLSDLR